jgi:hypothetical protein
VEARPGLRVAAVLGDEEPYAVAGIRGRLDLELEVDGRRIAWAGTRIDDLQHIDLRDRDITRRAVQPRPRALLGRYGIRKVSL